MTPKNYIREMIRRVLTIADRDLPEFVWLATEWHELVFSNNIRKREKEFLELKKLVLLKTLVIEEAPEYVVATSFMFDKILGEKLKSRKKTKTLSNRLRKLVKLRLEIDGMLDWDSYSKLFGPSYGTVYESPSVRKKVEKTLSELRRLVKEFYKEAKTVEKELQECVRTFSSETLLAIRKSRI